MQKQRSPRTLLWYQVGVFGFLILISWMDELFSLPNRIFGGPLSAPNLREAAFETTIILLVAIPLIAHTRRVVTRPFYFEGFLRVCAWCKKVEHHGDWIPVAEFFQERFDTPTSHGMCPACFVRERQKSGAA
jgi:hypothetical protein